MGLAQRGELKFLGTWKVILCEYCLNAGVLQKEVQAMDVVPLRFDACMEFDVPILGVF